VPKNLHSSIKQLELQKNIYIKLQKQVVIDILSIAHKFYWKSYITLKTPAFCVVPIEHFLYTINCIHANL